MTPHDPAKPPNWHRVRRLLPTIALVVGSVALLIQVLGLILAIAIPYDSQGAVGKAFAAIFTQFAAIPLAVLGIALAVASRIVAGGFDKSTAWGLVAAIAALVPLSLLYVSVVR
jgi:hypothetical protein